MALNFYDGTMAPDITQREERDVTVRAGGELPTHGVGTACRGGEGNFPRGSLSALARVPCRLRAQSIIKRLGQNH